MLQVPAGAAAAAVGEVDVETWRRDAAARRRKSAVLARLQVADEAPHDAAGVLLEEASSGDKTAPPEAGASAGEVRSPLQDTFQLAQAVLKEAYGYGDGSVDAEEGASAAAASSAAAAAAVGATQRFTAADVNDGDGDGGGGGDEPPKSKGGRTAAVATTALKLGATMAQKYGEYKAAKAAARPKADQCVMCVYTLERMQQLLAPVRQARDTDILGGRLGRPGHPLPGDNGVRLPTSAYAAAAANRRAMGGAAAGPAPRPVPPPPPPPSKTTTAAAVPAAAAAAPPAAAPAAAAAAPPAADAPPADATMRFRQLLDRGLGLDGGDAGAVPAMVPGTFAGTPWGTQAAPGNAEALPAYPYDAATHPPAPPLTPAPAMWDDGAASALDAAGPPLSPLNGATGGWDDGGVLLETGAAAGVPHHLLASYYATPPDGVTDAGGAPESALAALTAHLEALHGAVAAHAREHEEGEEAYLAAWRAAVGHTAGEWSGSTFSPAVLLETADDGNGGGDDYRNMRTGTALDGAAGAPLAQVATVASPPVPPAAEGEGADAAAPAPATGAAAEPALYRDFAGEDAVFGEHPAKPEDFLSQSMEAGEPAPKVRVAAFAAVPGTTPGAGSGTPAGAATAAVAGAAKTLLKPAAKGAAPAGKAAATAAAPAPASELSPADGAVVHGPWAGGGDVPTHSVGGGRSGMTTEDVWFGKAGYVAPGYAPAQGANMRRYAPAGAQAPLLAAADMANAALTGGEGNKAAERVFSREGLAGGAGYAGSAAASMPDVPLADAVAASSAPAAAPAKKLPWWKRLLGRKSRFADAGMGAGADADADADAEEAAVLLALAEGDDLPPLGGLVSSVVSKVASAVTAAAFPLPHSCRSEDAMCAQRMRQPSVMDLYRRQRRDMQRAAMNRALLSYSLALDMLCERDAAGIDGDENRDVDGGGARVEAGMAGYPHLAAETHSHYGYLDDDWAYLREQTQAGDNVGIGSLRHFALPECVPRSRHIQYAHSVLSHMLRPPPTHPPHHHCCSPLREFCPKIRAKLAIVVERFLHGYDEEEVCYALKMCTGESVRVRPPTSFVFVCVLPPPRATATTATATPSPPQVWHAGPPTTVMGNAMKTLGVAGKVGQDQRV